MEQELWQALQPFRDLDHHIDCEVSAIGPDGRHLLTAALDGKLLLYRRCHSVNEALLADTDRLEMVFQHCHTAWLRTSAEFHTPAPRDDNLIPIRTLHPSKRTKSVYDTDATV